MWVHYFAQFGLWLNLIYLCSQCLSCVILSYVHVKLKTYQSCRSLRTSKIDGRDEGSDEQHRFTKSPSCGFFASSSFSSSTSSASKRWFGFTFKPMIWYSFRFSQGTLPVKISTSRMPTEYTSDENETEYCPLLSSSQHSGAMYWGVPPGVNVFLLPWRDRPKSAIFACKLLVNNTLSDLISRWTMFSLCKSQTPHTTHKAINCFWCVGSRSYSCFLSIRDCNDPPVIHSVTIMLSSLSFSAIWAPTRFTTCGDCIRLQSLNFWLNEFHHFTIHNLHGYNTIVQFALVNRARRSFAMTTALVMLQLFYFIWSKNTLIGWLSCMNMHTSTNTQEQTQTQRKTSK